MLTKVLSVTEGIMNTLDMLTRNLIHRMNPKVFLATGFANLVPVDFNEKFVNGLLYLLSSMIFPTALGYTLPLFMAQAVQEKSTRVKVLMQMHGLKETHYWLANMAGSFLLFLVIYANFYIWGRWVFKISIFTVTDPTLMVVSHHQHLLNVLWGCNQIGLAIILQMFVSSPRLSTILGVTVSVTVQFMTIYSSMSVYLVPFEVPVVYLFLPQMAFSRIYFYVAKRCMESRCFAGLYEFDGEALLAFRIFLLTAFLYPAIGLLLNNMQFYGCFSLKWPRRVGRAPAQQKNTPVNLDTFDQISTEANEGEPSLSEEIDNANNIADIELSNYSVVVRGVCKSYGSKKKQALKPMHLVIERGQVFGLLGPNGAGKTTLLNILTGMIPSDSGDAWIGGSNVSKELHNVYKSIGVCPQFDVFWDDLTIEEHLIFYLRLKGIDSGDSEVLRVDQVCRDVELLQDKRKKAKHLSGGMKRRLSLAVALIGEPAVIFLDEPTTGLDPLNREAFWKIIQSIKQKTSVILTTHLMQEADYLCDRIGTCR